jgi:F0F1-type ATP synthase delta subunit
LLQDQTGNRYFAKEDQISQALQAECLTFKSIVPLSDLLQSLLDSSWVKASSLGRTADALCRNPWLSFQTNPIPHLRPGNIPTELLQISREVRKEAENRPDMHHHH